MNLVYWVFSRMVNVRVEFGLRDVFWCVCPEREGREEIFLTYRRALNFPTASETFTTYFPRLRCHKMDQNHPYPKLISPHP